MQQRFSTHGSVAALQQPQQCANRPQRRQTRGGAEGTSRQRRRSEGGQGPDRSAKHRPATASGGIRSPRRRWEAVHPSAPEVLRRNVRSRQLRRKTQSPQLRGNTRSAQSRRNTRSTAPAPQYTIGAIALQYKIDSTQPRAPGAPTRPPPGPTPLTANVAAPKGVERPAGRRREAHGLARGGGGAGRAERRPRAAFRAEDVEFVVVGCGARRRGPEPARTSESPHHSGRLLGKR